MGGGSVEIPPAAYRAAGRGRAVPELPRVHLPQLRVWKVRKSEYGDAGKRAALLLSHAAPVPGRETVPLSCARGRVAAQDIASPIPVPPFDRSPLDGYALNSRDIAGASRERPGAPARDRGGVRGLR